MPFSCISAESKALGILTIHNPVKIHLLLLGFAE